jgi:hypothetical protein
MPGPVANVAVLAPPGALVPSLAAGSAGGGDSTERDMMWAPLTIVRPRVRFSSVSIRGAEELLDPGAEAVDFVGLRLTRLNSSVSARTRFICYIQD